MQALFRKTPVVIGVVAILLVVSVFTARSAFGAVGEMIRSANPQQDLPPTPAGTDGTSSGPVDGVEVQVGEASVGPAGSAQAVSSDCANLPSPAELEARMNQANPSGPARSGETTVVSAPPAPGTESKAVESSQPMEDSSTQGTPPNCP